MRKEYSMAYKKNTVLPGKIYWILLISLVALLYSGCEKDDICVDGDTPLLIIRFYDAENTEEVKTVPSLRIVGLGQGNPVNTITDRSSPDSVGIPLRINEPNTTFLLIMDSADEDDVETGNADTLTFNYETKEVFVSRACGFVANYETLSEELNTGSGNWIQNIEIISSLVQTQDSAHVKIFH